MNTTRHLRAAIGALLISSAAQADELTIGDLRRTYDLVVPAPIAAARKPVPLVIALHGGLGSGAQLRRSLGLDRIAQREGFIVAYPDGVGRNWNDGRSAIYGRNAGPPPDDVAFLTTLARTLVDRGIAARERIYVAGVSNGGMMTYRLACETSGVFAGYAAMIANLSVELGQTCRPPATTRMLIMNGTDDPLMPFGGGSVARNNRGEVLSTPATYARWVQANGCAGTGPVERRDDREPNDGSRVEITRATGCGPGGGVTLYTIIGGGHQIPSRARTTRPLVDRFLGRANRDVEAAEELWSFFAGR